MRPRLPDRARRLACLLLAAALAAASGPAAAGHEDGHVRLPVVPYVPTPDELVTRMLEMAEVGPGDVVYDLGCGDGRIVIAAAAGRKARGVGIDIDPVRIAEANANARGAGVAERTRFVVADLFASDFSEATVVTLYLLPEVNVALRPQLWRQLRVGTRVVSHDYHMGDEWPPEQTVMVGNKVLYRWTIRPEHKARAAPKI